VRWVDIEVDRPENEAPVVVLHGETARIAEGKGIRRIVISITHDGGMAMAVAIAEG
jgi:phosphopantetheinyl transferase (holo-ACP synthase)